MNQKKTPEELRAQLIEVLQEKIIPNLPYCFNGHEFPFYFVKLDSSTVHRMVSEMETETDRFGRILNDMRNEGRRKDLINDLWNVFWWPAVDKVWPLQCFEIRHTEHQMGTPVNDLYLLARTGPDEWIGVQTKRCYVDD